MQTGGTKIEKKKTCAENRNMITVVGVRFKAAGKIYYFDPAHGIHYLPNKIQIKI